MQRKRALGVSTRPVVEFLEQRMLLCALHEAANEPAAPAALASNSSWDSHLYPLDPNAVGPTLAYTATDLAKGGGSGTVGGPITQSAYTTATKRILLIRIRFLDQYQGNSAYEPQSLSSAISMLAGVNSFFQTNSFGATSVAAAVDGSLAGSNGAVNSIVTPVYTFANTASWYSTNDSSGFANNVLTDAVAVATNPTGATGNAAANTGLRAWTYSSFDQYAVRYQGGPGGFSGQAWVGGTGTWLKSSSDGVAAHEFGHNLGLQHANAWNASPAITVLGPGSNNEYGEGPDTMGGAGGGSNAFNAYEKWRLDWLTTANITTATASGTYRIYAHDMGGVLQSGISYGLRITRDSDRDYWVSARQAQTGNQWYMNGVELYWDPWTNSNGGSQILDVTPNSPDGVNDAAITLGRTFSDEAAGFHFTTLAKGTTTFGAVTLPYFDVQINKGTFPTDQAPTASLSASATTVATNTTVTFTATASDPDADTLAYSWDFGDKSVGTNSASVTKSWGTAGDYRVRLVVSDMKGKSYSTSVIVRVGSPANIGRISGVVTNAQGQGVADVQITNGLSTGDSNYRYTFTDSDGSYTLVGLGVGGSYTVTAAKASYGFTSNFVNPVTAGTSTSGINFSATQTLYKISGTVTDASGTGIRGALVSDGTRTEVTDSAGNYTFYAEQLGSYTLTASKAGYELIASNFANPVAINFADVSTINFTEATYSVSGKITGVASATGLTITDGVRTATVTKSGSNYNFSLFGVPAGSWNLRVLDTNASPGSYTPSGFTNPLTVNSSTGNLSNKNFSKDASTTWSATGRVTDLGDGLAGATVSAVGPVTKSGTTDARGYFYIPGLTNGAYTLSVTAAGYSFSPATRSATVSSAAVSGQDFASTRTNPAPTVAIAAAANPNPVNGKTVNLSALGADDGGAAYLTYTWSTPTAPSGASTAYNANNSSGSQNTLATVTRAGNYVFRVTIRDVYGATVTSDVNVVVNQVASSASLSPSSPTIAINGTQQFTATMLDQFSQPMSAQPGFTWASTGGSITPTGLYTASAFGIYSITATSGGITASTLATTTYPVGPGTGIRREWWTGISGTNVSDLTANAAYPNSPTGSEIISSGGYFEAPSGWADNYGTRMRGYYIAPATGSYSFWIASDDSSELWLSTDTNPANKVKVAYVSGYTSSREWTKYASQQSTAISLVSGNRYYIEALQKEGGGGDNLAVRADLPGGVSEAPIPVHRLDPWMDAPPSVAPSLTSATGVSNNLVNLAWTYAAGSNIGFKIDRATDAAFTQATTTITLANASATGYADTPLAAGTTYYYRLRAYNAAGDGPNSGVLSASTSGANTAPTLANAAAATPTTITGTTTALSALGADDAGEAALTYTWSTLVKPVGATAPSLSANATNAAKSSTATFFAAGAYTFRVTIADAGGLSVTSDVGVTVAATLTSLGVSPNSGNVPLGTTLQLSAQGLDQFGATVSNPANVTWTLVNGSPGTLSAAGLYTPPATGGGAVTIRATSGALNGAAQLTSGNVLFADNFEPGSGNWTVTTGNYALVTQNGSQRFQVTQDGTGAISRSSAGNLAWTDYIVQGTLNIGSVLFPSNASASILARFQDDLHVYFFQYNNTAGVWRISEKSGSNTLTIADSAPFTLSTNTDYVLRAEVQGTALRLYVNGVLQVQATNADYATGRIGFSSSGTQAALDNVVVFPFNAAPTIAAASAASPSPVTGTTTNLSVLGADDAGAANIRYTWSVLSKPAGAAAPTFSANATNAAKSSTATFFAPGAYSFRATLTDADGATTTSDVSVTVNATLTSIAVAPASASLELAGQLPFSATGFDQFGVALATQPPFSWSASAGSFAGATYTAGLVPGPVTVTASNGSVSGFASLTVSNVLHVATPLGQDDAVTLIRDAATPSLLNVIVNGALPKYQIPFATLGQLFIDTFDGADVLTLDTSAGAVIPAGGITFDAGSGTDALAVVGTNGADSITTQSTSITLNGGTLAIQNLESASISTGAGDDALTINSASPVVTFALGSGLDTATFNAAYALSQDAAIATPSLAIIANASVTFAASQHLRGLQIGASGNVVMTGAAPVLQTQSLDLAPSAILDIGYGGVILDAGSAAARDTAGAAIATARNGTDANTVTRWNGPGIRSSAARAGSVAAGFDLYGVGVFFNGELADSAIGRQPYTLFAGQNVSPSSVLIRYTYAGDADLNGFVDGDDYALIDNALNGLIPNFGWLSGDFNSDTLIDGDDYALIDSGFLFQGPPLSTSSIFAVSPIL